jgi:phosphotriesterase-related protein
VEGTGIRAGFLKLAANNDGPLPHDEIVYRAAARAAIETGATIGMHSMTRFGLDAALEILDDEKFDLSRFIWAHAARDGATDYATLKEIADRGAYISFDGIAYDGVPSDEQVLDFIEQFYSDNFGDKVLLSSDSVISAHPPMAQYDMNIRYTYRHFKQKLDDRFGEEVSKQLLRDNVVTAYRQGDRAA